MSQAKVKMPESADDLLDSSAVMLPSKPRLLMEIDNLMRNPDFEVGFLAESISRDPGVLAALFKLCRSPAYSRGRPPANADMSCKKQPAH